MACTDAPKARHYLLSKNVRFDRGRVDKLTLAANRRVSGIHRGVNARGTMRWSVTSITFTGYDAAAQPPAHWPGQFCN